MPVKAVEQESAVLLFRTGALREASVPMVTWTLTQATTKGAVVGGSTFILKAAKPR